MTKRVPYPNAPITEAIIDIRVQVAADVGLPELLKTHDAEEERYPVRETLVVTHIQGSSDGSSTTSREERGYRFKSQDGHNVYQARLDGFTMNRLAPYEHWEKFRTEAQRLWNVYQGNTVHPASPWVAGPIGGSRCSLTA